VVNATTISGRQDLVVVRFTSHLRKGPRIGSKLRLYRRFVVGFTTWW
jgi:hypothetical protein